MSPMQIAAIYAAFHLILAPILILRVGRVRIANNVNIGDGGNDVLFARIRAHANYTENTPLALIGLFALALLNASSIGLHIFGAGFLLGRILHAHGMAQSRSNGKGRLLGVLLSLLSFLGMAIYLLILIFTSNNL
ncbi:MAG: MAPEG family protein [Litorimonas sp.]